MDFPSFGDAAAYDQLGRACAEALAGRRGTVFEACYHPVRPPGAALLMSAPYLVTRDPVDAAYMALSLNLVFFALAVLSLGAVLIRDGGLLPGWPARSKALAALAFVVLLLNLVSHIPVRLGDLPALSLFLCAIAAGAPTLAGAWEPGARRRRYALVGVLAALAALLKISQLPFSLALLLVLLAVDRRLGAAERLRCAGAFLLGFSPVALQFLNVWAHTGVVWFYDPQYMRANFSYVGREWGVEAVIYTLPAPAAYMVRATGDVSHPTLLALRLFRGLFGFEWAVYRGEASRGPWWALSPVELGAAWLIVLAYLAISSWSAWRAPVSLRLLNGVGGLSALLTAAVEHTELRYYVFPRAVLWVTLACLGLWAWRRGRSG